MELDFWALDYETKVFQAAEWELPTFLLKKKKKVQIL